MKNKTRFFRKDFFLNIRTAWNRTECRYVEIAGIGEIGHPV